MYGAWEHGARVGAVEATLHEHQRRLDQHTREIDHLRTLLTRGALLLVLGLGAIGANLSAKEAGEFAGTTLKSLLK